MHLVEEYRGLKDNLISTNEFMLNYIVSEPQTESCLPLLLFVSNSHLFTGFIFVGLYKSYLTCVTEQQ